MKNNIRNLLLGSALGISTVLGSGCKSYVPSDFPSRLGIGVESGIASNNVSLSLPSSFGDVPPHIDDPGSKTRKVNFTSGHYTSNCLGISFSPLPFNDFLSGFQLGYRRLDLAPDEKQTRSGLSKMEWYEYGAYAGTYTRVNMDSVDQWRLSYRQKISLPDNYRRARFLVEAGVSANKLKGNVADGWDRYYSEEKRTSESFSADSVNPFFSVGFGMGAENVNGALIFGNLFFEKRSFDTQVPQGDIKIDEKVIGASLRLGF